MKLNSRSGQIVVEYVLLLVVAVMMATIITRSMVSRNPDSLGFMIGSWMSLTQSIGQDYADDVADPQQ